MKLAMHALMAEEGAPKGVRNGPSSRRSYSALRRAYTLIEISIVLLVLGILASVAIPKLSQSLCQQRVNAAVERIMADLEMARRAAKTSGISRSVQFDTALNQYTLANVKDVNHPLIDQVVKLSNTGYPVTLVSAAFNGTTQLTFDLYGKPLAGSPLAPLTASSIVVQSGKVQGKIIVTPATGKAQIQ